MKQYTERQTIMISKKQAESLAILKSYDVNVSQFIRIAIKEKLQKDWKQIKERKEIIKMPF
jgi:post-segregation antitoxin (ccd killing protein)